MDDNTGNKTDSIIKPKNTLKVHLYAIFIVSYGLFYGYGLGIFNNYIKHFIKNYSEDNKSKDIYEVMLNLLFAIGGCIISVYPGQLFYNKFGRLYTLLVSNILEFGVIFGMLYKDIYFLCFFRCLHGMIGVLHYTLASLILEENLPSDLNDIYNTAVTGAISLGVLYGYLFMSETQAINWRYWISSLSITEFIKLIILYFYFKMESSKWMASNNMSLDEIKKNYSIIYSEDESSELAKREIENKNKNTTNLPFLKTFFSKEYSYQVFVVIMLSSLNNLSGGGQLEFYSTKIFESSDIPYAKYITLILAGVSVIAAVFNLFVNPFIGLRNILIYGLFLMNFGYYWYIHGMKNEILWLKISGPLIAYFGYCISLAGARVSYSIKIVPSIIFPACDLFNHIFNIFITLVFPIISNGYLEMFHCMFIFQGLVTFIGLGFIIFSVDVNKKNCSTEEEIKEAYKKKKILYFF